MLDNGRTDAHGFQSVGSLTAREVGKSLLEYFILPPFLPPPVHPPVRRDSFGYSLVRHPYPLLPSTSFLSPVPQQDKQILHADDTVAVQIGKTIIAVSARSPGAEQDEEIGDAHRAVAI